MSRAYILGAGEGPLASGCTTTQFEHYPLSAYMSDSTDGEVEMELCEGQRVMCSATESEKLPPGGKGVIFGRSGGGEPLRGKLLMRIVLHERRYALGFGMGSMEASMSKDPEYDPGFLGLYHGGYSTNVCAYAKRVHRDGAAWGSEHKLAVLFNFDDHTMRVGKV